MRVLRVVLRTIVNTTQRGSEMWLDEHGEVFLEMGAPCLHHLEIYEQGVLEFIEALPSMSGLESLFFFGPRSPHFGVS